MISHIKPSDGRIVNKFQLAWENWAAYKIECADGIKIAQLYRLFLSF